MRDPAVEKFITLLLTKMRELETETVAIRSVLIVANELIGQPNVKPYPPHALDALVAVGRLQPALLEKMREKYQQALDTLPRQVAEGILSPEDERVLEELSRKTVQN